MDDRDTLLLGVALGAAGLWWWTHRQQAAPPPAAAPAPGTLVQVAPFTAGLLPQAAMVHDPFAAERRAMLYGKGAFGPDNCPPGMAWAQPRCQGCSGSCVEVPGGHRPRDVIT